MGTILIQQIHDTALPIQITRQFSLYEKCYVWNHCSTRWQLDCNTGWLRSARTEIWSRCVHATYMFSRVVYKGWPCEVTSLVQSKHMLKAQQEEPGGIISIKHDIQKMSNHSKSENKALMGWFLFLPGEEYCRSPPGGSVKRNRLMQKHYDQMLCFMVKTNKSKDWSSHDPNQTMHDITTAHRQLGWLMP